MYLVDFLSIHYNR